MKRSLSTAHKPLKELRKIRTYTCPVVLEEDPFDDGRMAYHAYCPVLRDHGASTWGYTPEEALKNIQEVLQLVVASMIRHGEPIPPEVQAHEEPLVTVIVSDGRH